jgi:hypothetical protein
MSLVMRIVVFGLTGLAAGVAAWPLSEVVLFFQAKFISLLVFNCVLGVSVGLVMGGVFGMSEGALTSTGRKAVTGGLAGLMVGTVGGIVGFFIGQAALLYIGTWLFNSTRAFQLYGYPLTRSLGWALFGMCIGTAEGVRSRSLAKLRNGLIGGFLGGLIGGLVVEFIRILAPANKYARLGGFALLGMGIGIFYGFVENRLAGGLLRVLNGTQRGTELPLTKKYTTIGSSPTTDVTLHGNRGVTAVQTGISKKKGTYTITAARVNDENVEEQPLRDGDIIRVGDTQFQFIQKKEKR